MSESAQVSISNLTKRIVPCLDVRDGVVVKGVKFRDHLVMGDILDLALRYRDEGADELVFYDITASPEGRSVDRAWVSKVAHAIDIPFSVAGGIRSVDSARAVLHAGADKISINTPALQNPDLINALSEEFGAQCVVVGIDSLLVDAADGALAQSTHEAQVARSAVAQPTWRVYKFTGDPSKTTSDGLNTLDWVREVQARGAGEIVLNCMGSDGAKNGYDLEQLKAVRAICNLPLIASGGAGQMKHFSDAFVQADVDAALAASVFHSGQIAIPDLKKALALQGIKVRC
jgi:imidazole glycerol-phosphate synthase subunit HisF